MHCSLPITENLFWVGANDRRIALFENTHPVPQGISYNSYVLLDEKTALFDTVDAAVGERFFENLAQTLQGRTLDYVIVTHMEPDHCATLAQTLARYPNATVVGNSKTFAMIDQFFDLDLSARSLIVKEGDTLSLGTHTLRFLMMPMVHWPEVMSVYDETDGTLFSADAFGSFGALSGQLFADEVDFEQDWLPEMRRYYVNIVGKYGVQVQAVLKKVSTLDIRRICPLHGLVWRKDFEKILSKYDAWSSYTPEESGVLILSGSVYGHTYNAAENLAGRLAALGVPRVKLYDVSALDPSYLVSEAFRYSHLVIACATYNNGIFVRMETLLADMKAHALQNRTVGLIQNGTWAPVSGKLIREEYLDVMKNMRVLDPLVTLRSALKPAQQAEIDALAGAIANDLL